MEEPLNLSENLVPRRSVYLSQRRFLPDEEAPKSQSLVIAIEIIFIYLQMVFLAALLSMKLAPCDMYVDTCQNFSDDTKSDFVKFDDYINKQGLWFRLAHMIAGGSLVLVLIPMYGQYIYLINKASKSSSKKVYNIIAIISCYGPIGGAIFIINVV